MKKTVALLLVLMMLMGVLAISVNAIEATNYENAMTEQENADCSCGGSYGNWTYPAGADCQGSRYYRECDSCDNVQTAKDITPKTISYALPAIGANEGDVITLSLYSVYFTASEVKMAEDIVWSSEDIDIVDGCIYPTTKGTYELTATVGSTSKNVYLVVKEETESEYVLFYDDFTRDASQEDENGKADVTDSGYTIIEQPTGTEAYIKDGALVLDTMVNANAQMRVLLPDWIGNFGEYKIDTSFAFFSAQDSSRWFAVMARVGNNGYPLWQAAVRQGAKSHSSGIEVSRKTSANAAWDVPYTTRYSEDLTLGTYYTLTFNVSGINATHSINGKQLLDTSKSTDSRKLTDPIGRVGFHLRASEVSVDSIKIVVPIDDSIHDFGEWKIITEDTCTTNGLKKRTCANCDFTEESVIVGGHKLISYALKAPNCTESGYDAYETCERCDHTTFLGEFGPFGHYFDREFKSVAHRGFSATAPENTLPAYTLARELGFLYAECDVAFTKDGVAVLLHDATIDRTSNGGGKISELTYEELLQYDFGSWKNAKYAGTKIPTFEEFIALCKEIGLHPYIEIKNDTTYTEAQVQSLVDIVEEYGLADNSTWISFNATYLKYVKNADDTARLGYVSSSALTQSLLNTVIGLRSGNNEVFLDINYTVVNDSNVLLAASNGVAVETWTVDSESTLKKLPKYVSGITSNTLNATDIFVQTTVTEPTCKAEGYTTYTCVCGEAKNDNYVPATDEHTYDSGECTVCGKALYCADPTHNLEIISISYENGFDKLGVKVVKCLDCNASETEAQAPALFTCLRYSVPEDGRAGIALGFIVDNDAIKEYEKATGKNIRYGAFAVAQSKIGANEIFDENGSVFEGALCADATEYDFSTFHIKVVGFEDSQKDLPFAMGAYVAVTDGETAEYSYIQSDLPNGNEKYSFVSYNDIVNLKQKEEEVEQ